MPEIVRSGGQWGGGLLFGQGRLASGLPGAAIGDEWQFTALHAVEEASAWTVTELRKMKAPGQTPLETYLSTWSSGHDRGADGLNGEWAQRMDRLYKQLYGVDTKEAIQSAVEVVADSRKALERANQDIKNLLSNREYLVHAIVDMQKKLDQLINRSSNSGEEQQLDEGEEPKEGPL